MHIRLIEPRAPGLNVYDQTLLPRLGLPLIARALGDAGHDVRVYAESLAPVDWDDVGRSDLVGLSTTTTTAPAAYRMAERCRRLRIPTVVGGSHVTFLADEALEYCDYVVRGEGHRTILELIAALQGQRERSTIAGLSYRDAAGRAVHNAARPLCSQEEFAALPAPDLSLIAGHERMTTVPVMTQWGCPFDCDFCSVIKMFGRRVRSRKIDDVLSELECYRGRGPVFFYDDNFIVNKDRTRELLSGMISRDLGMRWSAQVRADAVYKDKRAGTIDRELLELMRASGCHRVYCGFESVNPETLKAYNKHQDVETVSVAIRAFHDYGVDVHGMFVLGSDADDKRVFNRTASFALENRIDTVQFMMLTPCPGTAFYERIVAEGRLLTRDWSLYDGHHCLMQPAQMTAYELQAGTHKALVRFYSARRSIRLLAAALTQNLPFLLSVFLREKRLRLRFFRIALLSLLPSRRADVIGLLKESLSPANWRRLQEILVVPVLRLYALKHIRQWAKQAGSRAHIAFLRHLPKQFSRA